MCSTICILDIQGRPTFMRIKECWLGGTGGIFLFEVIYHNSSNDTFARESFWKLENVLKTQELVLTLNFKVTAWLILH